MAVYTTRLRSICESIAGKEIDYATEYADIDDIIEIARKKIFDFQYEIPAVFKQPLEHKILSHYYMNEIGQETYGVFHLFLKNKMREIMPYYNKLYESVLIDFNPMEDIDLTTHTAGKSEVNENGNGKTTDVGIDSIEHKGTITDKMSMNDNGKQFYSDTPQNQLSDIDDGKYLTTYTKNTANNEHTNTRTFTGNKDDGTHNNTINNINERNTKGNNDVWTITKGKTAGHTYSQLLNEYRDTIINIDSMIIRDLRNLFMLIY